MDLLLLLTGVAIGVAVTAPLGPVNILVIRNAIRRGFLVALLVGLGAVVADVLYAAAAAYGVSWVSHLIEAYARPLMIAGGVLLVVTGVWLARKRIEIATIDKDEAQTAKLAVPSVAMIDGPLKVSKAFTMLLHLRGSRANEAHAIPCAIMRLRR